MEDVLGNADLADVVQERPDLDRPEFLAFVTEPSRERNSNPGDALGVTAGVVVLGLHAPREGGDRVAVCPAEMLCQLAQLYVDAPKIEVRLPHPLDG